MRKLNTQDVFKLARLIKKANLKNTITELLEKGQSLKTDDSTRESKIKELGVEVVIAIVEKAADESIENDFYSLVAGIAEKTAEDIKNMSLEALSESFVQIGKENNIGHFFNVAYQSAGKLTK